MHAQQQRVFSGRILRVLCVCFFGRLSRQNKKARKKQYGGLRKSTSSQIDSIDRSSQIDSIDPAPSALCLYPPCRHRRHYDTTIVLLLIFIPPHNVWIISTAAACKTFNTDRRADERVVGLRRFFHFFKFFSCFSGSWCTCCLNRQKDNGSPCCCTYTQYAICRFSQSLRFQ